MMPANAAMTDAEITSVLTYVRSNFGNKADAITAEMVKKQHTEVGQPPLTVKDLIDPEKAKETRPVKKEEPKKK